MSTVAIPATQQKVYSEAEINTLIDKKLAQRAIQCCQCTGVAFVLLSGSLFLYMGSESRRIHGSHDPHHIMPTIAGFVTLGLGAAGAGAMIDWNLVSQKMQDIGVRARIISNIVFQAVQEYRQRTTAQPVAPENRINTEIV